MELTKAEIDLINEKRANDLELKKASAIASVEKTIARYKAEEDKKFDAYQKFTNQLNDASMSKGCGTRLFDFVVVESEKFETPSFYDNDNNMVNLDPIAYTSRKFRIVFLGETVESEYTYFIDEEGDECMDYSGNATNTYKKDVVYIITVEEHKTGSSYREKNYGFKMNINGLFYNLETRSNNGKNISNPNTVISKINEDIEMRKRMIENTITKNSLKERAMLEVETLFPNTQISEYDSKITIKFDNGTSIECYYYDDNNGVGVRFVTNKVSAYGVDLIALGNMLQTLSRK